MTGAKIKPDMRTEDPLTGTRHEGRKKEFIRVSGANPNPARMGWDGIRPEPDKTMIGTKVNKTGILAAYR